MLGHTLRGSGGGGAWWLSAGPLQGCQHAGNLAYVPARPGGCTPAQGSACLGMIVCAGQVCEGSRHLVGLQCGASSVRFRAPASCTPAVALVTVASANAYAGIGAA
jgi:hypothetical protein